MAIAKSAPSASHSSSVDVPVNASCEPVGAAVVGVPPPPADTGVLPGLLVGVVVAVVLVGAPVTITVPVMNGWTRQWYANWPACEKTCEKELPGLMHGPPGQLGLESKGPVFEVTLWITEPVLVHVTVVPEVTVIVAGEKAKSTIETCDVAAGAGGATGRKGFVTGAAVVGGAGAAVGRAVVEGAVVGGAVVEVTRVCTDADAAGSVIAAPTRPAADRPMPITPTPIRPVPIRCRLAKVSIE